MRVSWLVLLFSAALAVLLCIPGAKAAENRALYPGYSRIINDPNSLTSAGVSFCGLMQTKELRCGSTPYSQSLAVASAPEENLAAEDISYFDSKKTLRSFYCKIAASRQVQCSGSNEAGQTLVPSGLKRAQQLALAPGNSCVIGLSSTVCWGAWLGTLKAKTKTTTSYFSITNPPRRILAAVVATQDGLLAQMNDGSFWRWKLDTTAKQQSWVPTSTIGLPKHSKVQSWAVMSNTKVPNSSGKPLCAILNTQKVYCGLISKEIMPLKMKMWQELTSYFPAGIRKVVMIPSSIDPIGDSPASTWCATGVGASGIKCRNLSIPDSVKTYIRQKTVKDFSVIAKSFTTNNLCMVLADGNAICSQEGVLQRGGLGYTSEYAVGNNVSCALNNFGELSCWGYNDSRTEQLILPAACSRIGVDNTKSIWCKGPYRHISIQKNYICADQLCWGEKPPESPDASDKNLQWDCSAAAGKVTCWAINSSSYGDFKCTSVIGGSTQCNLEASLNWKGVLIPKGTAIPYSCSSSGARAGFCIGTTSSTLDSVLRRRVPEAVPPDNVGSITMIAQGRGKQTMGTPPQEVSTDHVCAVTESFAVTCWGRKGIAGAWLAVDPSIRATQVALGDQWSCALLLDKTIKCWGTSAPPVDSKIKSTFQSIQSGVRHLCGLGMKNSMRCWTSGDSDIRRSSKSLVPDTVNRVDISINESKGESVCAGVDLANQNLTGAEFNGRNCAQTNFSGSILSFAKFQGSNLSGANFKGAKLAEADLRGANLSGADLRGADLGGADISGADLRGALVDDLSSGEILSDANTMLSSGWKVISGYILAPGVDAADADLSQKDLSGLNLSSVNFKDAKFSNTNLSNADLSDATLSNALIENTNLTGTKLASAFLDGLQSSDIYGSPGSLPSGMSVLGGIIFGPRVNLSKHDVSNLNLAGVDLSGAVLNGFKSNNITGQPSGQGKVVGGRLIAVGVDLSGEDLSDLDFSGLNLSRINMRNTILNRVDLRGSNLYSADMTGAHGLGIQYDTFTMLPLGLQILRGILIGPNGLSGADLSELDLSGIDFSYVSLNKTDLHGANLSGANLSYADIQDSNFNDANLSGVNLYGAQIKDSQFKNATLNSVVAAYYNDGSGDSSDSGGEPIYIAGSDFSGAKFREADINRVSIGPKTVFTSADFTNATLQTVAYEVCEDDSCYEPDVDIAFDSADFSSADLSRSVLQGSFAGSKFSAATQLDETRLKIISGNPILPDGWKKIGVMLAAPGVDARDCSWSGQDLSGVNLSGAHLDGCNLSGSNLQSANLQKAGLNNADLSLSSLGGASIGEANFSDSKLEGVQTNNDLEGATTLLPSGWALIAKRLWGEGAVIKKPNLSGANLLSLNPKLIDNIYVSEVTPNPPSPAPQLPTGWAVSPAGALNRGGVYNFKTKNWAGADLSKAKLEGAYAGPLPGSTGSPSKLPAGWVLVGSGLNRYILGPGVNAKGINLKGINLLSAANNGLVLSGVSSGDVISDINTKLPAGWKLIKGYLVGAKADLREANLSGADISSADLKGVNLSGANLDGAIISTSAVAPDFTGATLSGLHASGVKMSTGAKTVTGLPTGWALIKTRSTAQYLLVGPGADLSDISLYSLDLSKASLSGARFSQTSSCRYQTAPSQLPGTEYSILSLSDDTKCILGPGAKIDLSDASPVLENNTLPTLKLSQTSWSMQSSLSSGLSKVDLRGADLRGAYFDEGFDLSGADLGGSQLGGSDIGRAVIDGTRFDGVLSWPSASGLPAKWKLVGGVVLRPGADLRGVELNEQDLRDLDLTGANLTGAKLMGSDLTGTRLQEANLPGANFTDANLTGASLAGANLSNAVFTGSILDRANLSGANIDKSNFQDVQSLEGLQSGMYTKIEIVEGETQEAYLCTRGAPLNLPSSWKALSIPEDEDNYCVGVITGPEANLSSQDVSRLDLSGVDLNQANLYHLSSGNNKTTNIKLPAGWKAIKGYLIGPTANLDGSDLRGLDLSSINLAGVSAGNIRVSSKTKLPAEWWSVGGLKDDDGYLFGPGVDLSGANLSGMPIAKKRGKKIDRNLSRVILDTTDLSGVDLSSVDLSNAEIRGPVTFDGGTKLPESWSFLRGKDNEPSSCSDDERDESGACPSEKETYIAGPGVDFSRLAGGSLQNYNFVGMNLSRANFTGVDLSNSDLSGADLSGADLSGATGNGITIDDSTKLPDGWDIVDGELVPVS